VLTLDMRSNAQICCVLMTYCLFSCYSNDHTDNKYVTC